MSTRSVILSFDGKKAIRFYKHCDGYPTEILSELIKVLSISKNSDEMLKNIGNIAGAKLDDDKPIYKSDKVKLDFWGNQDDLEWIYLVDFTSKNIVIYGGRCGSPQTLMADGPTNPEIYVDKLIEKYQANELKRIKKGVLDLQNIGWDINIPLSIKFAKECCDSKKIYKVSGTVIKESTEDNGIIKTCYVEEESGGDEYLYLNLVSEDKSKTHRLFESLLGKKVEITINEIEEES